MTTLCTIIGGAWDGQTREVEEGESVALFPNGHIPESPAAAMPDQFEQDTLEDALAVLRAWGDTVDGYLLIPRAEGIVAYQHDADALAPEEVLVEWEQYWGLTLPRDDR